MGSMTMTFDGNIWRAKYTIIGPLAAKLITARRLWLRHDG